MKKYTKQQIRKAINYWEKQLKNKNYIISESINLPGVENHHFEVPEDQMENVLNYAVDLIKIAIHDMKNFDTDDESSFTHRAEKFLKTIKCK